LKQQCQFIMSTRQTLFSLGSIRMLVEA
jgi:hypothetical protein